jgi:serine/threonine-protein kinase
VGSLEVTPATWAQLNRLLDHALDLPEPEREAWLDQLAPGQRPHAARLRALLASAKAASPVDALAQLGAAPPEEPAPSAPGVVGPYRLLRRLGEGGMGTVWLAQRNDLMVQRRVALKLPRVSLPGAALSERMAREREILAALSHPNIARLLDAGVTADGRPYLALEYVEGRPIDVHAREEHLSVRARLLLFQQILAAVAHAHGRLVVHRDLKPSNILVTRDGEVRLLDFGVAKLLEGESTPATELTLVAGAAFTPNYASPEQLAGEPIGVSSDLYSLGVVLYELLAEVPPYQLRRDPHGSLHEALRSAPVRRPSDCSPHPAGRKALAGDLDTLVLKALKLSSDERYPTADAFSDEVGRFLGGYPIRARPDSAAYRLRKLVQRHRAAVAAAVAVSMAVLGGASAALWQARRATAEQRHAEEVKEYLLGIFREASPYGAQGRSLSAVELIKRAHAGLDRIGERRPALRVELLNMLGSTLLDFGDIDAGERVAAQALEEASQGLPPDHAQRLGARVLRTDVLEARGRDRELGEELERLIPELERRAREQPGDLVRALHNRAKRAIDHVQRADAIRDAQRAFELARGRLGEQDPRTVESAVLLAEAHQYGDRDYRRALQEAERGLGVALRAYPGQPNHPRVLYARDVYGRALCHAGQADQALEELGRALQGAREVLGPASPLEGMTSVNSVICERRLGYLEKALEDGTRGIEIRTATMQRSSRSWGNMHASRGATWLAARRAPEALEDLSPAVDTLAAVLGQRHRLTLTARANRMVALAYVGRAEEAQAEVSALEALWPDLPDALLFDHLAGTVFRLAGRYAEARAAQVRALERVPDDPVRAWNRMRVLVERGLAEVELGLHREAEGSLQEALTLSQVEQRRTTPLRADAWVGLGRALDGQRRTAEAVAFLERADAYWRAFDADNPAAAQAALWLGRCYRALGRRADAEVELARVRRINASARADGAPPPEQR